jgi:hypothetical protein
MHEPMPITAEKDLTLELSSVTAFASGLCCNRRCGSPGSSD